MIKCKIIAIVTLLLVYPQIMPLGGGMFLYRHIPGDVEFLFALDPAWLNNKFRSGFEYPGGKIDPSDMATSNKPYSFLYGAARETLEELVFMPSKMIKKQSFNDPYENKTLEKNKESNCINDIVASVTQQGIFFIYKPNVTGKTPPDPNDQTAVFFFDITNICPLNLPEEIVNRRIALQQKNFDLNRLHAEPVAFAWVKSNDLLPLLSKNGSQWVNFSQYAEHDAQNNRMVTATNSSYKQAVNQNQICISSACIGMMRDREMDQYNPQVNIAVIKKPSGDYIILHNSKTSTSTKIPPAGISSSMRSVIDLLQNHSLVLNFTSAPPPPPAQKFDVQGWIKTNSSKLKDVIKKVLLDNDLVNLYDVITHDSLTPIGSPSTADEDILKPIIEKLRLEVVNEKKKTPHHTQPAKKIVHPNANQLLTQALELAALLKK